MFTVNSKGREPLLTRLEESCYRIFSKKVQNIVQPDAPVRSFFALAASAEILSSLERLQAVVIGLVHSSQSIITIDCSSVHTSSRAYTKLRHRLGLDNLLTSGSPAK